MPCTEFGGTVWLSVNTRNSVWNLLVTAFQLEVHCGFWMFDMSYILPQIPKKKVHSFGVLYTARLKYPASSKNTIVPIIRLHG